MDQWETAAQTRIVELTGLQRYVAASRRLLDHKLCDRCGRAAAVTATGAGMGLCGACSTAALDERRASFARAADCQRQIDIEKARAMAWDIKVEKARRL